MEGFWQQFQQVARELGLSPAARQALAALLTPLAGSPPPAPAPAADRVGRYEDLGQIGAGGMGAVLRVRDPALHRTVALKVIAKELCADPESRDRFVEEAQATAQLQHPGIVPVFELGQLEDGRLYYTMREVVGRTLSEVVREVFQAAPRGPASGWTVRRLVDAFHQACQAVGFAHRRGVLHRDLKPGNIMLGDFGEVYVVDWGLAKVFGAVQPTREADPQRFVRTRRQDPEASATQTGEVLGTPAYMPPEQARGEVHALTPASDVYALGAVLFEILCGSRAVQGRGAFQVLARAITGIREPLEGPLPIPPELAQVVERAMQPEPADRYPDAVALAAAVGAWLEGESQRERALSSVAEADALLAERDALLARAAAQRADAAAQAAGLAPWDPVARKQAAWDLEDAASALDRQAAAREAAATQHLQSALTHRPDLDEALDRLADLHRTRLLEAEAARDLAAAARSEALLRATGRPAHLRWVDGEGTLCLATDPPGARARLYRYEPRGRRLVAAFAAELGTTPLQEVSLPPGSYLVLLEAEGRAPVRVPVQLGRLERWEQRRPADGALCTVSLPPAGLLGPGVAIVPPGPARVGGDPLARRSAPAARVWVEGFAMDRAPVRNADWLLFINDRVAAGRAEEAVALTPRVPGAYDWRPTLPVCGVDHPAAQAYAAWRAARTGLPWRLPTELEWEKAARGADGRRFPWGDHLDPTWCSMADSREGGGLLRPAGEPPEDESPYGVLGLGGNVADWCADAAPAPLDPAWRAVRGGRWNEAAWASRASSRTWLPASHRDPAIGLRLVCAWP